MIRLATLHDLDDIFAIRIEASKRMKKDNIHQWQEDNPSKEQFKNDILHQQCYVFTHHQTIIGMATIQSEPEYTYASLVDIHEKAYTLHRIAIKDGFLNQGIGSAFFEFMEQLACQHHVKKLYVDTHPDNIKMQKLIHKHEFIYVGEIELKGIKSPKRSVYFKSLTKC